jgi:hypothetical protein
VDFVVVGGVAAVLRGAPVGAFDLDVVRSTAPQNIGKLLAALEDLDACYCAQPERRLRPDTTHLSSPGRRLLMTRLGPADLLGTSDGAVPRATPGVNCTIDEISENANKPP